jgi:hypothetical protein
MCSVITVAIVTLLRDTAPYGIIFMTVRSLLQTIPSFLTGTLLVLRENSEICGTPRSARITSTDDAPRCITAVHLLHLECTRCHYLFKCSKTTEHRMQKRYNSRIHESVHDSIIIMSGVDEIQLPKFQLSWFQRLVTFANIREQPTHSEWPLDCRKIQEILERRYSQYSKRKRITVKWNKNPSWTLNSRVHRSTSTST